MTSTRGSRLREAREAAEKTLRDVEEAGIISFSQLAKYEANDSIRIKPSVMRALAAFYHTSVEYLQTGQRTGKESFSAMPTRYIVTNKEAKRSTLLVPHKAEAGYRKHFSDEEYLGTLPTYSLPGFEHGNYRMFEVNGDSMRAPDGTGFEPGDIVICEHVDSAAEIVNGTVYVIVTTEGICLKRVTNLVDKKGWLVIESDNPAYSPDIIQPEEVLEMWSYRKKLTV